MKKKTSVAVLSASLALTLSPSLASAGSDIARDPAQRTSADNTRHDSFIIKYKEGSRQANSLKGMRLSDRALDSVGRQDATTVEKSAAEVGTSVKLSRPAADGQAVVVLEQALDTAKTKDFVAELESDPAIEYVEPDLMMRATATPPNDTHWDKMWDLKAEGAGLDLLRAWDVTKGRGARVAVLDTGITQHPDLDANVISGYDFISDPWIARDAGGRDSNPRDEGDWVAAGECGGGEPQRAQDSSWHGTHVAGTIGAVANDNYGIPGIAPEAKIQPVRVLGRCGGRTSDITDAITWASGGSVPGLANNPTPAHVVNLSLGGYSTTCPRSYQDAINGAVSRGVTVVVAAGNESTNVRNSTPANCSNVLVVGSVGSDGSQAYYSNYGAGIDVSGQGGDLRNNQGTASTVNTGRTTPVGPGWSYMQGTSMAAPHVAGVAALMKAANSSLTPAQIESRIKSSVKPMGTCWAGAGNCGAGILNGGAAVAAASDNAAGSDPAPTQPAPKPGKGKKK